MHITSVKPNIPDSENKSLVRFHLFINENEFEGIGILNIERSDDPALRCLSITFQYGPGEERKGKIDATEIALSQRRADLLRAAADGASYTYECIEAEPEPAGTV
jgi:hypothetical protein